MILGSLALAWALSPARAAAPSPAKPRVFPGAALDLKTADGWPLKAKHLPAKAGKKTFVLLHGTGGRKEDWYYLAKALARRGYGYLAVDLRGHGESKTAPDGAPAVWRKFRVTKTDSEFQNMVRDVEAAVSTLTASGIAEESVGIIGSDVGGSVGLKFAAVHEKVPLVVLLSPGMSYQEVTTVNAMRAYKGRPILMVHSEADRRSAKETPILYAFARASAGERNATVMTAPAEHGTKMLRGPLIGQLVDWIENPVRAEVVVSTEPVRVSSGTAEEPEGPVEP